MNIISQKFNRESLIIIKSLKRNELKSLLCRQRLKFTYEDIHTYVKLIFSHTVTQKTFKYLYKKNNLPIKYSCFMNNIALFSILFKTLYHQINKRLHIVASKLLNIVDSTLILEKQSKYITQKDWRSGRTTTRIDKKTKVKTFTCGSKGLFFLNRFGQIYSAKLMGINFSDQNVFKDYTQYLSQLKGIVLADRGFSNKAVRERLTSLGQKNSPNDMFNRTNQTPCRLISPHHYKQKINLTNKEFKTYKRRWKIETLFQRLKHNYSETKLNLTGKYQRKLKEAKFYSTVIMFNYTTLIK